jgi:predicted permease
MQILGLLTIILPLLLTAKLYGQPWFWTWGFVAASAFCSGAAVPLYLYVPTEWSAIVAWLSSAFVILQGMFITGHPLRDVDKNKLYRQEQVVQTRSTSSCSS